MPLVLAFAYVLSVHEHGLQLAMHDIASSCPHDYHSNDHPNNRDWVRSPPNASWSTKCYRMPSGEWGNAVWHGCATMCRSLYCSDSYCSDARPVTVENAAEQAWLEQEYSIASCEAASGGAPCAAGGGSGTCCFWTGFGYAEPGANSVQATPATAGDGAWQWHSDSAPSYLGWSDGASATHADGCAVVGIGGSSGWQRDDCSAQHRCVYELVGLHPPSPPSPTPAPLTPPTVTDGSEESGSSVVLIAVLITVSAVTIAAVFIGVFYCGLLRVTSRPRPARRMPPGGAASAISMTTQSPSEEAAVVVEQPHGPPQVGVRKGIGTSPGASAT